MTNDLPTAYPLQWPTGRWRNTDSSRSVARFSTNNRAGYYARRAHSVSESVDSIRHELELMGVDEVIVSTNLALKNDGWPRSGQAQPRDPGVAVYFHYQGKPVCLACDQWTTVEDNLWAVALTLEAMRGIDRWGAAQLEATFTGYAALPAPEQWWTVLGVPQNADADTIRTAYRTLARANHPDAGGSSAAMARINAAYEASQKVPA